MSNNSLTPVLSNPKPNMAEYHLTARQLKYYGFIQQGMTKKEAARLSGYSEETAPSNIEKTENLRKALLSSMDAQGLTTDKLAKKIADGVDKKKKYFSTFQGSIVDERDIDDNETQHRYVVTALSIRGDLVKENEKFNVNVGIIEMPGKVRDVEDWNTK